MKVIPETHHVHYV